MALPKTRYEQGLLFKVDRFPVYLKVNNWNKTNEKYHLENIPGVKSAVVIKGTIRTGGIDLRKTSVHLCEFLQWATFQDLVQFKTANNISVYTHTKN